MDTIALGATIQIDTAETAKATKRRASVVRDFRLGVRAIRFTHRRSDGWSPAEFGGAPACDVCSAGRASDARFVEVHAAVVDGGFRLAPATLRPAGR